MHFETKSVHTGVHKDEQFNSVITPIYASSTFYWNNLEESSGYDYTRSGNPTRDALQENLAALEGGAGCSATCTARSLSSTTGRTVAVVQLEWTDLKPSLSRTIGT